MIAEEQLLQEEVGAVVANMTMKVASRPQFRYELGFCLNYSFRNACMFDDGLSYSFFPSVHTENPSFVEQSTTNKIFPLQIRRATKRSLKAERGVIVEGDDDTWEREGTFPSGSARFIRKELRVCHGITIRMKILLMLQAAVRGLIMRSRVRCSILQLRGDEPVAAAGECE